MNWVVIIAPMGATLRGAIAIACHKRFDSAVMEALAVNTLGDVSAILYLPN
jgi:hypothetical protein